MKQFKFSFLLTILMSMVGATASAHDIEVANAYGQTIYYNWNTNKTELLVTYKYPNPTSEHYTGSIVIPESVVYEGESYNVTGIDQRAFSSSSGLTSVSIPNSVTSLGRMAFSYCSALTSVNIPSSVTSIGEYAFESCSALTSIIIPTGMTSIDRYVFYKCTSLTSVTIPNGVRSIGEFAFYECPALTSITIPSSVESINQAAFMFCTGLTSITIPSSVTSIGNAAFSHCSELTSIIVEDGNSIYDSRENCNAIIETASNQLIAGCATTVIPSSVTAIGGNAFNGSSLNSITIPGGVTSIGNAAFYGCKELTSITIPGSVTSIGIEIIGACIGLTSIIVEDGNSTYDSRDNCNAIIETASNQLIAGCATTVIPNSVTSIGDYAFYEFPDMTSITIPEGVTSIGQYSFSKCSGLTSIILPDALTTIDTGAFYLCTGLTSVIIPDAVTTIGNYAFRECSGLTSVTIGAGVTSIGNSVFYKCTGLTDVYCLAENVPSTTSSAFSSSNYSNATLHVHAASVEAYQAQAPWKNFKEVVALQKCATPTITYDDGKLSFSCETEDVMYTYHVTCDYTQGGSFDEVQLTPVLKVTAYASKENYGDSDVATIEIPIDLKSGLKGDLNDDSKVNALDIQEVINIASSEE